MGAIGLSINFTTSEPLDHDKLEELGYTAMELIQNFLQEQLERETELKYLEDIDETIELDCEGFEQGEMTFLFHDHWPLGSELSYHWYEHALATPECKQIIREALAEEGLIVTFPLLDPKQISTPAEASMPFIILEEEIISISPEGYIEITEGVELELTDSEQILVDEIQQTQLCQCQLCLNVRED